jgi:hypothetical protein
MLLGQQDAPGNERFAAELGLKAGVPSTFMEPAVKYALQPNSPFSAWARSGP